MKYDWLLFDADNTLFNFDSASRLAFDDLLSYHNINPTENLYHAYKKRNKEVWTSFEDGEISSLELRPLRFKLFFDDHDLSLDPTKANKRYLENLVVHAHLIEGALLLLKQLYSSNRNMVIITNGLKEVQRRRINKAKLNHYFKHIIVSDEIGMAKPSFDYFDHVHELIGKPKKENVLVIGDNLKSDIAGGNNFGYKTCWYKFSNVVLPNEIKPDYTINQLSELYKII